jgi:hypothetical protein
VVALLTFVRRVEQQAKQDHRTLKTTIWSPEAKGTFVAAPDFPISSLGTPGIACTSDVAQQPDDVSFVITSVLKLDRQHGSDGLGAAVQRTTIDFLDAYLKDDPAVLGGSRSTPSSPARRRCRLARPPAPVPARPSVPRRSQPLYGAPCARGANSSSWGARSGQRSNR